MTLSPQQRASLLAQAIAAFERRLISMDSPYDRYRYGGDRTAILESAKDHGLNKI